MPIPPLNEHGLLPAGIHAASWRDIEAVFLTNTHRERLYWNARQFFERDAPSIAGDLGLYLGGSFFSDKEIPADIEATMRAPVTHEYASVLALGSEREHNRIKAEYGVDFYISVQLPGHNDFVCFFQYVGPKTAASKGLNERDRRGVIEVVQWKLG